MCHPRCQGRLANVYRPLDTYLTYTVSLSGARNRLTRLPEFKPVGGFAGPRGSRRTPGRSPDSFGCWVRLVACLEALARSCSGLADRSWVMSPDDATHNEQVVILQNAAPLDPVGPG
jgi:hypothetical protein